MPILRIETEIAASPDACYALMRDERLQPGIISDGRAPYPGQTALFNSTFLGRRRELSMTVIEAKRPEYFVDGMTSGYFTWFLHMHRFKERGDGTLLIDEVEWISPAGTLGSIVDILVIGPRLRRHITDRNARLKRTVEAP